MAKQGSAEDIAVLRVGLEADPTQLNAGLNQAKADTEATAAAMGAAVDKSGVAMQRSFGETVKAAKAVAGPMRALIGLSGAVVAAITSINTVVDYLVTVLGDGKKKAEEFLATIGEGVGKQAEARLEAIRARIQDVQSELAENLEKPFLDIRGRSRGTIEGELKRLRASEKINSDQLQAATRIARKDKERTEEAERWKSVVQQGLDIEEKLSEAADSQADAIMRKFKAIEAIVGTLKAGGEDNIADRLAKANSDAFARAMAVVAKQIADEFRKVGKEITDDMRNAMRDSLRQIIPDIRAIGPKLDLVNRSSNRLYGRGI